MDQLAITYNDIHSNIVHNIAPQVREFDPEYIIGIVRGGMLPAIVMSHALNDVPVIPVSYSSKYGKGGQKGILHLPSIPPKILSGTGTFETIKILIVDDIADSGYTLKDVVSHYSQQKVVIKTYTVCYKESSIYTPDFYSYQLKTDAPWVVFPYEK